MAAAGFDLRVRRIPNALIAVGLTLGLAAQVWMSGVPGLVSGASGIAAALVVLIGPFALRALGGGDVKLGMVIGAWTSASIVLTALVYGALLTGLIAGAFWTAQALRPADTAPRIPVAVPLGAATILTSAGLLPSLLPLS